MVVDHLSRINDVQSDDVLINGYFPYDRPVAFVRVEDPLYSRITVFLQTDNSGIRKTPEEVTIVEKSSVPWYADYINYFVVDVLPSDLTYQQKKWFFHNLKQ